jgi:hypothetical protein
MLAGHSVLASQALVALLAFARAATLFVARASVGLVSFDVTATGLALFWRSEIGHSF